MAFSLTPKAAKEIVGVVEVQAPAILLNVDGEAVRADIAGTNLGFVVNSNFPLFFEKESGKEYYLYTGEQWLKSASQLTGLQCNLRYSEHES